MYPWQDRNQQVWHCPDYQIKYFLVLYLYGLFLVRACRLRPRGIISQFVWYRWSVECSRWFFIEDFRLSIAPLLYIDSFRPHICHRFLLYSDARFPLESGPHVLRICTQNEDVEGLYTWLQIVSLKHPPRGRLLRCVRSPITLKFCSVRLYFSGY